MKNLAQELDGLAKLHAEGALTDEEFTQAKNRVISGSSHPSPWFRGIRARSPHQLFGLPLWSIALGPDWESGELRGHAKGIFAFGDIATGWFAFGGLARGFVAIGGLALGLFAFGGASIGLLAAFGGAAIGTLAVGGGSVGVVAIGGGAFGYYALGGSAAGVHVLSALYQDPAALEFFQRYVPWLTELLRH